MEYNSDTPSDGLLLYLTQYTLNGHKHRDSYVRGNTARLIHTRLTCIDKQLAQATHPEVVALLRARRDKLESRLLKFKPTELRPISPHKYPQRYVHYQRKTKARGKHEVQRTRILPFKIHKQGISPVASQEEIVHEAACAKAILYIKEEYEQKIDEYTETSESSSETEPEYERGSITDTYHMQIARARACGRRLSLDEMAFVKNIQARNRSRDTTLAHRRALRLPVQLLSPSELSIRLAHDERQRLQDMEKAHRLATKKRNYEEINRATRHQLLCAAVVYHRYYNILSSMEQTMEKCKEHAFNCPDVWHKLVRDMVADCDESGIDEAAHAAEMHALHVVYVKHYNYTKETRIKMQTRVQSIRRQPIQKRKLVLIAATIDSFKDEWEDKQALFQQACARVYQHLPNIRAKAERDFLSRILKKRAKLQQNGKNTIRRYDHCDHAVHNARESIKHEHNQ